MSMEEEVPDFDLDFGSEEEVFDPSYNVVLVMGLDESGKSALLSSMIYGEVIDPIATDLRESQKYAQNGVNFEMREIGGRYRFRDDWPTQFGNAKALIWVVDSIDRGRIIECREEFEKLMENQELASLPMVVAINKQDARIRMKDEDLMQIMKFERYEDRKLKIIKTSKKACYELIDAMDWLIHELDLPGSAS